MEALRTEFTSREELAEYVRGLCPWTEDERGAGALAGGRRAAEARLAAVDPERYARSRNFADGAVTRLSPYLRHGVLSLNEVRNAVVDRVSRPEMAGKLIQELAWRDFWQRIHAQRPEWIWNDVESYKTGFAAEEYADELPPDIEGCATGVACIDTFLRELVTTGYLHNHARMYVAAYVVHWRRVRWQVGARWFLRHLLDGDPASNNLSWQWVASTFSNKPYIFNLENVDKYFGRVVDTSAGNNAVLDGSYEELGARLFPRLVAGR